MPTLSPNVQATVNAGLGLLFDGLSEIPAGEVQEIIADIKTKIDTYNPGAPASFQQWLNDSNALLQAVATDTGNPTIEKDAAWIGQIVTLIAEGKTTGTAIFLSLFKKHTTAASITTPTQQ